MTSNAPRSGDPLLSVTNLDVRFPTADGIVHAVQGVSFGVHSGETLGVVGESGSGKSVTALAIMRLLPGPATVAGSITFDGTELSCLNDRAMSRIRGKRIAMVFQDPMTSLDPVYSIGYQITETLRQHDRQLSAMAARARAVELLQLVGIPDARRQVASYPHEFSGGMRQRVVIAIAMANEPDVIIADEPTTALDVTVQAQVLEVLHGAQEVTGAAIVLITHDLGVLAGFADRVMVMYAGRVVELGTAEDVYYTPRMPYTVGLLGSLPRMDSRAGERLVPIPGSPPSLLSESPGCPFSPRCPMRIEICDVSAPALLRVGAGDHVAACHRSSEVGREGVTAADVFDVHATGDPDLPAELNGADNGADDEVPGQRPADTTSKQGEP